MAKLTKEELISKIKDSAIEDEMKIELLEDITDSFEIEDRSSELEEMTAKYEDLKSKYIARFETVSEESKDEEVKEEPKDEEIKEEEVIDVKEI